MARRPTQRQLFAELTAKYGAEFAAAFVEAMDDLRSGADLQLVVAALERGDIEGAIDALHLHPAALQPLRTKLEEAYLAGGQGAVTTLPRSVGIGVRFDMGNPIAAEIIRQRAARLITGLIEEQRQAAREVLAQGMARGAHPRSVALDLVGRLNRLTRKREGGILGLSGPQRVYLETAKAELASADPKALANYLNRSLRDRRYDRTIRKAIREGKPIPAATARNAAASYAARMEAYRGEVVARTEALPAIRAAKHEAFRQLIADGRVDADDIVKGWHTIRDGRERDTHAGMDGQEVRGLDQPFTSPSGAQMQYPGDTSLGAGTEEIVSCRCDESIAIKPRTRQ